MASSSPERFVVVPDQLAVFPRAVALLAEFVHGLAGHLHRLDVKNYGLEQIPRAQRFGKGISVLL